MPAASARMTVEGATRLGSPGKRRSRATRAMAGRARTTPTVETVLGRSPNASPTSTGTTADVTAERGATTPIGPLASAE